MTKKSLKKENAREARYNSWFIENKNERREKYESAVPNKFNNSRKTKLIDWFACSMCEQTAHNRW